MKSHPGIDFDIKSLRESFLSKRQDTSSLNNQVDGPALRAMLGSLESRTVLEVGCGAGDLAVDLAKGRLKRYLGLDISTEMVALASTSVVDPRFAFQVHDIEHPIIETEPFDVAICALTLHFVRNLSGALTNIADRLVSRGELAFSMRHPLRTSNPKGLQGGGLGWLVKDYFLEGPRQIEWHGHSAVIAHRTISSVLAAIREAKLQLVDVLEIRPDPDVLLDEDRDHAAIPGFIHVHCKKL